MLQIEQHEDIEKKTFSKLSDCFRFEYGSLDRFPPHLPTSIRLVIGAPLRSSLWAFQAPYIVYCILDYAILHDIMLDYPITHSTTLHNFSAYTYIIVSIYIYICTIYVYYGTLLYTISLLASLKCGQVVRLQLRDVVRRLEELEAASSSHGP